MKNRLVTCILALIAMFTTGYIIYRNVTFQKDNNRELMESQAKMHNNMIIQYMEAVEYPLDTCYNLSCYKDSFECFATISKSSRIGLYVDAHHCRSCWQKEIAELSKWYNSLNLYRKPIVLANHFNQREIMLMQKDTEFPIYSFGDVVDFINPLTKFNQPFFFLIDNGKITRPFFPNEKNPYNMSLRYFEHVNSIMKSRYLGETKKKKNKLSIYNPVVNLGRVRLREKKEIKYKLHNKGSEPCMIYKCMPSCSCVVVDSFSTAIPAGKDGFIAISSVQVNKGDFYHSINIQTNFQAQPYSVTFSGLCE